MGEDINERFIVGRRNVDEKGGTISSEPIQKMQKMRRFRVIPLDSYRDDQSLEKTVIVKKGSK